VHGHWPIVGQLSYLGHIIAVTCLDLALNLSVPPHYFLQLLIVCIMMTGGGLSLQLPLLVLFCLCDDRIVSGSATRSL